MAGHAVYSPQYQCGAILFPGFSPTRPMERERERETLENAGHVAPEQN